MAKMSREEARYIRNKNYNLSSLIEQNLLQQEAGPLVAVGRALKEKFNVSKRLSAKAQGIKEKFNPLNIVKFMTGFMGQKASNIATAGFGRMFGFSTKDIQYFTKSRSRMMG